MKKPFLPTAALGALAFFATATAHAQDAAPEEPELDHETLANEKYYLEYKLKQPADANLGDSKLYRYYALKKECGVNIPVSYSDAWVNQAIAARISPASLINQVYQALGETCSKDVVYRKAVAKIKRISLTPGGVVGTGSRNQYGYVFGFSKATGMLTIKYPKGTIYDITQEAILRTFIEKNLE
ncbi:MAG: hypothetical protein EOO60_13655 [Hymenobacter sp.]|nr:MAG: hypothetical protein EOO60_13655 [Hymenobacter sp.]